uniref:Uncharacterized protein n=1 Tax=Phasianus colchicus TaxID=9054 RepID=A0A669Q358_PHACC
MKLLFKAHGYLFWMYIFNITCFSLKERLFLVRTLWLYLIIIKFFCFFFSLLVELAKGFNLFFFFTNSFLSVFPA